MELMIEERGDIDRIGIESIEATMDHTLFLFVTTEDIAEKIDETYNIEEELDETKDIEQEIVVNEDIEEKTDENCRYWSSIKGFEIK